LSEAYLAAVTKRRLVLPGRNGAGGLPGADLITLFVHTAINTDPWDLASLPSITIQSGDFHIGWIQTSGGFYDNAIDTDTTFTGRSYVFGSSGWVSLSPLGDDRDAMTRQRCR
jgi:hypothetical protein